MKIKNCPKCDGPATIRRERYTEKLNNVWVECERCQYRTGSMYEDKEPGRNDSGVKLAIILWNSAKIREEAPEHGKD